DGGRMRRKLGELECYAGCLHEAVDTLWHAIELLGGGRRSGATSSVLHQLGALIHHVAHRLVGVLRPAPTPESAARLRELCLAYRVIAETYFALDPRFMIGPILASANAGQRAGGSRALCRTSSG